MRKDPKTLNSFLRIKQITRGVFDLIYPRLCVFCRSKLYTSHDYNICAVCAAEIKPIKVPFCLKCGTSLDQISQIRYNGCGKCANKQYYFDQVLSACKYKGMLKHCIHLFKYKRKRKTKNILSDILIRFLQANFCPENIDLITAVPLHRHKLRERGFNQSELIAAKISSFFKIENSFNNLCRIKKTVSQVTLTAKQRQLNTTGAFSCKQPGEFKNKRILLVDDIFTTGSTLNECARVLKQSGAKKVTCLTIAR
ncbi:MAG: ComF family protein [Candidatus Omnitrophica bacterium]|nr:ComF family protein [Candidatus Omnitrophota bacterium]